MSKASPMLGDALFEQLQQEELVARTGRVTRILPTFVEADGPACPLGTLCVIETGDVAHENAWPVAEVVGVQPNAVVLVPLHGATGIVPGARVRARPDLGAAPVGDGLLGRAVDGLGRPIDGGAAIRSLERADLDAVAAAPLDRLSPTERLETGVRAIDTLLTLAKGQRVGVFAASGVGKTTLLTQLISQVDADVCVICLVGERGREVEHLWAQSLAGPARRRAVLVAATSDQAAALRVRACSYAVAIADHWRSRGAHVLLVVDSVTRYAMALREVGLAAGEPPTVRAYTPGVFAALPRLVEGCGAIRGQGAVTAIFTVLSETDDGDDPISETMRSILDGHIILSRELAEQAHFPAIDVPKSVSRLARAVQSATDRARAEDTVALLSTYETARTLIETGVYRSGSNAQIDAALEARPRLLAFLRQDPDERVSADVAGRALAEALGAAA